MKTKSKIVSTKSHVLNYVPLAEIKPIATDIAGIMQESEKQYALGYFKGADFIIRLIPSGITGNVLTRKVYVKLANDLAEQITLAKNALVDAQEGGKPVQKESVRTMLGRALKSRNWVAPAEVLSKQEQDVKGRAIDAERKRAATALANEKAAIAKTAKKKLDDAKLTELAKENLRKAKEDEKATATDQAIQARFLEKMAGQVDLWIDTANEKCVADVTALVDKLKAIKIEINSIAK